MSLTTNKTKLQTLLDGINALPVPEYQSKTVTPTTTSQTITPDDGYNGMTSVTVAAIPDKYEDRTESLPQLNTVNGGTAATTMAAAVDNTEALVSDEDALITQIQTALEGTTYDPSGLQKKVIQPMVDDQIITADGAYQALSQVTVKGDSNLAAENIAEGVSIFGVTGTHSGGGIGIGRCLVNISASLGNITYLYCTLLNEEGVPEFKSFSLPENTSWLCASGSIICFVLDTTHYTLNGVTVENGTILRDRSGYYIIGLPSSDEETTNIIISMSSNAGGGGSGA